MTNEIVLTEEQSAAIDKVKAWLRSGRKEFALGGYAGTGKTTIIDYIRRTLDVDSTTLTPTGKAAEVLRRKGVDADTIHSYLYDYKGLRETGAVRNVYDLEGNMVGQEERYSPEFETKGQNFEGYELVIVDEASMVTTQLYDELMSRDNRVLWVGDHGQLPPVGGDPGIMANLDARLETIHRQAADNPILRIAKAVREGGSPRTFAGASPDNRLRVAKTPSVERIVEVAIEGNIDQIIVPFNDLRQRLNREYRNRRDLTGSVAPGDRVICTKNNRQQGLFNGMIFEVRGVNPLDRPGVIEIVAAPEGTDDTRRILALEDGFGDRVSDITKDKAGRDGISIFDYGYAITAHKSQGSEWPSVLVIDQKCRNWDMDRWRYTAYTRAKETLTIGIG